MEHLKYPIGRYTTPANFSREIRVEAISTIEHFPRNLMLEVEHLSEEQLDTPYRPDGWTIRQVVNHCADSHMNALIRFKLALTESTPVITPYKEALWANLADGKHMPIHAATLTLRGVHERWVVLLIAIKEEEWQCGYFHPEKGKVVSLAEALGSYAWHCKHHLAHITELKKRMGWK